MENFNNNIKFKIVGFKLDLSLDVSQIFFDDTSLDSPISEADLKEILGTIPAGSIEQTPKQAVIKLKASIEEINKLCTAPIIPELLLQSDYDSPSKLVEAVKISLDRKDLTTENILQKLKDTSLEQQVLELKRSISKTTLSGHAPFINAKQLLQKYYKSPSELVKAFNRDLGRTDLKETNIVKKLEEAAQKFSDRQKQHREQINRETAFNKRSLMNQLLEEHDKKEAKTLQNVIKTINNIDLLKVGDVLDVDYNTIYELVSELNTKLSLTHLIEDTIIEQLTEAIEKKRSKESSRSGNRASDTAGGGASSKNSDRIEQKNSVQIKPVASQTERNTANNMTLNDISSLMDIDETIEYFAEYTYLKVKDGKEIPKGTDFTNGYLNTDFFLVKEKYSSLQLEEIKQTSPLEYTGLLMLTQAKTDGYGFLEMPRASIHDGKIRRPIQGQGLIQSILIYSEEKTISKDKTRSTEEKIQESDLDKLEEIIKHPDNTKYKQHFLKLFFKTFIQTQLFKTFSTKMHGMEKKIKDKGPEAVIKEFVAPLRTTPSAPSPQRGNPDTKEKEPQQTFVFNFHGPVTVNTTTVIAGSPKKKRKKIAATNSSSGGETVVAGPSDPKTNSTSTKGAGAKGPRFEKSRGSRTNTTDSGEKFGMTHKEQRALEKALRLSEKDSVKTVSTTVVQKKPGCFIVSESSDSESDSESAPHQIKKSDPKKTRGGSAATNKQRAKKTKRKRIDPELQEALALSKALHDSEQEAKRAKKSSTKNEATSI